ARPRCDRMRVAWFDLPTSGPEGQIFHLAHFFRVSNCQFDTTRFPVIITAFSTLDRERESLGEGNLALIPDEVVAEIRDRIDIVAVIGEHVQLKKAGASWKGLCPFHQEKTPSFHVSPARHSFYCFGCQKKGDVFSFLMELGGKGFTEAVRELAARVGVTI